jgi:ribosomal protein S18 acetylase RimI-like enzyme
MPETTDCRARRATLDDVDAIVDLHAGRIADGFLVTLGRPFLRRLYRRLVRSRRAFVLVVVVDDGGDVCGFVAATEDTGAFYREFLVHDGLAAGITAVAGVARAPRAVFETMRYGFRGNEDAPAAEIMAIAVAVGAQRRGLGALLVVAAVDELRRRGVPTARVVTAVDNVAAIRAYELGGFHRRGFDQVHRDVTQQVLVWP